MKEKKLLLGVPCTSANGEMDADILFPILRSEDRQLIGYKPTFNHNGVDVWNAYEFSFFDQFRRTKQGVLQIRYKATSEIIIESKSLKLYLNSFDKVHKSVEEIENIIQADLSRESKSDVAVKYYTYTEFNDKFPIVTKDHTTADTSLPIIDLDTCDLSDTPYPEGDVVGFVCETLRSNCKITKQPDAGVANIYIRGTQLPTSNYMYKLITQMRTENHFHEEIAERIMYRLIEDFSPDEVGIHLSYHRRGGIDINPIRYWCRADLTLDLDSLEFIRWVGQ